MDLYYLETYIEAVKLGSISKAARKLYLSQPAVSLHIQKLEQELGFRLINRDRNNFSVTREGTRFFHFAEYVQQEHKNLMFDLNQLQRGGGNLIIISNSIIAEFVLPPIMSEFKRLNPSIDYKLLIADSYQVIQEVEKGSHTVGFCGVQPDKPGLEYIQIGEDEIVIVVYPGHPFSGQPEINVSDLLGESLILHSDPLGKKQTFSRELRNAGLDLENYQPKLILGTTTGLISAVESKSGIALISSLAIKHSEAAGRVKVVKIKDLRMRRALYCIHRKEALRDVLAKDFLSTIKSFSEKQGYGSEKAAV